eukprot:CAMPEP_0174254418 /NCGR_PEP_ID=MMETSP0439-20130205/3738_1 /TAXON_ID=0 /ORGANISM="Stereomyxa ramosa, Strain Chinc5" /LENGTH=1175 /DNA_ID=CAMNT_0015335983 /DNA_START=131 /DNA_END=3658 /DNA_ORIENTATION=-
MKTVSVGLVCCLNIGVDPPDVIKTAPCARLECWIDPNSAQPQKALDQIGKALQQQYERWQSRARYKQCLDPTTEEVKKLCQSLRRSAKTERVLFHYNGHGVPKPTTNGEIWVFNKNYTQYIPLSIYELQTWMGSPSIYVFDCPSGGLVVDWFLKFIKQRENEQERQGGPVEPFSEFILLAACGQNEVLPTNPELPADLFTSCLTTPIRIALQWFCSRSITGRRRQEELQGLLEKLPGHLNNRRTPLGELNWIFTAVTDTIAWNVLPPELFQKLFRQDLLVASLFRNYLLAERIMRSSHCRPVSYPELPPTYNHPIWQSWDLAADIALNNLADLVNNPNKPFRHSSFFKEQLTAFEVWLEFGNENKRPPEQLPIVLQVLLSQTHRIRALVLLSRFLDLGPWAVNLALSVGIFPYVLKLLQSPSVELCHSLVFIWAKILALDKSCRMDLVKDNGHNYFINILRSMNMSSQQRMMAAFVLAAIMDDCNPGKIACLNSNLLPICLNQLNDPDASLRRWICVCLAKQWEGYNEAKWFAIRDGAHKRLCALLTDVVPEVRAAAVYALGTFVGGAGDEQRKNIELNLVVTLPVVTADGSPMVRRELIVILSHLVHSYQEDCMKVAKELMEEDARTEVMNKSTKKRKKNKKKMEEVLLLPSPQLNAASSSVYGCLWKMVLSLSEDPVEELGEMAGSVVNYIHQRIDLPLIHPPSSPSLSSSSSSTPAPPKEKATPLSVPSVGLFKRYSNSGWRSPMRSKKSGVSSSINATEATTSSPLKKSTASLVTEVSSSSDLFPSPPLPSNFYSFSCATFYKPIMSPIDQEQDVTHPTHIRRLWRTNKRLTMIAKAKMDRKKTHKLDEQIAILDNETEMASHLLFYPLENYLVVTDRKDLITVWNWEESRKVNSFSNNNEEGTRISSMTLVNVEDDPLLLTATDSGVVRIWAMAESEKYFLVTAWKALPDLTPRVGPGMLVTWLQNQAKLMCSGDVGVVRMWDVERELAIQDIPTGSESCVSSMCGSSSETILGCGCGDGTVRLFDCRAPNRCNPVVTYAEHKNWVVSIGTINGGSQMISGSLSGEVKFWDKRKSGSLKTISIMSSGMTAFAVHPYTPIFASGSQNQKIKVMDFEGNQLNLIRYHEGFLGQRIGPVSCMAFHPCIPVLAAGGTDSIVSVYTDQKSIRPGP